MVSNHEKRAFVKEWDARRRNQSSDALPRRGILGGTEEAAEFPPLDPAPRREAPQAMLEDDHPAKGGDHEEHRPDHYAEEWHFSSILRGKYQARASVHRQSGITPSF